MNTQLQQVSPVERMPAVQSAPTRAGFFDLDSFELMQRVSKALASSDLVPQQYRGNLANCMIALDMAQRIGANPLMTMQNLYVVHGTPGWSSKFLIATVNACGRFSSLRYEWRGEPGSPEYGCRAWAKELATGERLDGIWVTWMMVKAEGWDGKNGSKWKTMPDQMFVYRAAAFWQRAYAPELAMGLQTVEDLHDVIDVTPQQSAAASTAPIHVPTPQRRKLEAPQDRGQVDQQTGEIQPTKMEPSLNELLSGIDSAPDREAAEQILSISGHALTAAEHEEVRKAFEMAWNDAPQAAPQPAQQQQPAAARRQRAAGTSME